MDQSSGTPPFSYALHRRADAALLAAVRKAIREHKRRGLPLVVWRDGKVAWVQAEDLENPSADRNEKE